MLSGKLTRLSRKKRKKKKKKKKKERKRYGVIRGTMVHRVIIILNCSGDC